MHITEQHVRIVGTGSYTPKTLVLSEEIDRKMGLRPGTVAKKTGLRQRYFAGEESASDMAAKVARVTLDNAGLSLSDVDCLISGSGTMEQHIPCNAARFHAALRPPRPIPAFDVNMTCLGALAALDMAVLLIRAGRYKTVLIISSDIASVGLDWSGDVEVAGNFGDGAAAMIVRRTENKEGSRILACAFETYSEGITHCEIPGGGTRFPPTRTGEDGQLLGRHYQDFGCFRMKGKEVFKLTAKILPSFVKRTLKSAGLKHKDIDWVVPHQASRLGLNHVRRRLGFSEDKFITSVFETHGNQIAVSIVSAFHCLLNNHPVKKGQKVLLLGTSAGVSIGAVILEI